MNTTTAIQLKRETQAVQIPSGNKITLPGGTSVLITQSLGGTYTVMIPHQAGLYRISADDADALGMEKSTPTCAPGGGEVSEEKIWDALRTCYDPEIPVNIVDLGLIYSMELRSHEGNVCVNVKMTLTAPGCGMGPTIAADAKDKILQIPGVRQAQVDVVWEPAWNPSMISPEGRKKLGMN